MGKIRKRMQWMEEEREVRFVDQDQSEETERKWRESQLENQRRRREQTWEREFRWEQYREERGGSVTREAKTGATVQDLEHLVSWRWKNQLRDQHFQAPQPAVFNAPYQNLVNHSLLMHLQNLRQMLRMHLEEGLVNQRISDLIKVRELNQEILWLENCLRSVGLSLEAKEEEAWVTLQGPLGNKVIRIMMLRPE